MSERTKTILAACVVAAVLGGAVALWLWWSAPAPVVVHPAGTDGRADRADRACGSPGGQARRRAGKGLGKGGDRTCLRLFGRKFALCLLTASLLSCPWQSASIANAGQPANEVIGVPKGWVSPEKGYWMPETAGRDLLEAYRTAKDEASIARAAFLDLDADYRNFRTASVTAPRRPEEAARPGTRGNRRGNAATEARTTEGSIAGVRRGDFRDFGWRA